MARVRKITKAVLLVRLMCRNEALTVLVITRIMLNRVSFRYNTVAFLIVFFSFISIYIYVNMWILYIYIYTEKSMRLF